ncbi:MAG: hypothetical protein EA001_14210 [Oscillatoriales cyanobacterium]|nr:MAG: hypothetical protein EA001_14210 [Oscillatoriales cyanobacterium]
MSFEVLLIVILALIFLFQWLDMLDRDRKKVREAEAKKAADKQLRDSLDDLLKQLNDDPENLDLYKKILGSMNLQEDSKEGGKEVKASQKTSTAYQMILRMLAANPRNTTFRYLALEAGRCNCRKKFDGAVPPEEEQAIMNDITTRAGVGPTFQ